MRVKCPICHKKVAWEENPYRPFCSERCKLIDLGQWATEQYKVPGEEELSATDQTEQQEEESSNNGEKTSR